MHYLSKWTNQRVYRKELFKEMFTGSADHPLPSSPAIFSLFLLRAFPTISEPGTGYSLKGAEAFLSFRLVVLANFLHVSVTKYSTKAVR